MMRLRGPVNGSATGSAASTACHDRGMSSIRVAVCQMNSGPDAADNIAVAAELVAQSARLGAEIVLLPEKWNLIDTDAGQLAGAEDLDGPSLTAAASWARGLGLWLIAGSISERTPGGATTHNTSVVIDPEGIRRAVYRKIHLFDVHVGGFRYRESAVTEPGRDVVVAEVAGWRTGLSVCYDVRFPELYRRLADDGAEILTVPAAFTAVTGAAHWETLIRARAIENQCFVLAAGQVGTHATGTASHGRSMIVSPWGEVLAEVADGVGVAVVEVDRAVLDDVRTRLPALSHRRV